MIFRHINRLEGVGGSPWICVSSALNLLLTGKALIING
jgi:hypothetical protein